MIKVLFFIPTLDKGGAENVLVNLVNHMNYDCFDITVQTLFDKDSQKNILNNRIKYRSSFYHQFRGNSKILSLFPSKWLYKLIVNHKYDIVVSYLEGPTTHILSGCPFSDTRKVAWIHTAFDSEKGFYAGFYSKTSAIKGYQKYDILAFVAKTAMDRFIEIADVQLPKCTVLYNTIDSSSVIYQSREAVNPDLFPKSTINIISVGKVEPVKGYDRLVRVHKRLIDEGLHHHLYIIGSGKQQAELESFVKKNNLNESITFLGFTDNPYKYLSKADLFVCSSRREGFSTAVTEALILGLPVISTNCSGAYELLGTNNEYGIVTENSEEGLYIAIKKVLSNSELLNYYKGKSSKRGKQFSIEKTVSNVEKMLREILD